jgi:signal transduction histidine kinase/PAS domain-containing protein
MALDFPSVIMVFVTIIAFVIAWALNRITLLRIRKGADKIKQTAAIMQHTLDMGRNYVLMLDIRQRHAVNIHGDLLPEEGMSYEESFELIHPDDRHIYQTFIKRLLSGEAETDECIFRWDISGSKHLGQWRFMEDKGIAEYTKTSLHPVHIFCTLTDRTEQILLEREAQEMTNKYRRIFEQSLTGLAFYDENGRLMTTNKKMREILKFQSEKDPFYYDNTLFDMPTFRELLNNRRVENLYFCTKSIIIERGVNCYTEMRVHPIYKNDGQLYCITFSIRDVSQERELYLQNKKNSLDIRLANEAIMQYENDIQYLMDTCNMRFFRTSFAKRQCYFYKTLGTPESQMDFDTLIAHFVDSPFRQGLMEPEKFFNVPQTTVTHMHPFFHEGEELQWNIIDSAPYFDENGRLAGSYGIVRNVNDLIEKQERLKQETERANDSGRLKSVFMANMTHEIRTPLNSIVGFSDVLPMLSSQEEKQEIIRVIMNNCDMLMRLINDILAISSLDTGGIHLEPAETDFAKSFDDICESLKERVQEPGVAFIKDNPYTSFITIIDNARIQQVITNFVTNAVKYTHQGHIKAGYRYEDGQLYLYCEDTGAGIPKEHQGKIFERFVKLNDYVQGTGLGLSICKAIADACHGEIGVESEGDGHGSTFWMKIPCEEIKK